MAAPLAGSSRWPSMVADFLADDRGVVSSVGDHLEHHRSEAESMPESNRPGCAPCELSSSVCREDLNGARPAPSFVVGAAGACRQTPWAMSKLCGLLP